MTNWTNIYSRKKVTLTANRVDTQIILAISGGKALPHFESVINILKE
jgi:hypothetical protein